jgi:glutathione S-transferase
MKLYDFAISPNTRAISLVALETDTRLEHVHLDLTKQEQKSAQYLKLNPNGKVPVLQDGEFVLWETHAILTYIAASRPQSQLLPTDVKERADVDRWLFWKSSHLAPAIGKIAFERLLKPRFNLGAPDEKIVAQGFTELEQFGAVLDAHLAVHPYVANTRLSVADFALAVSFSLREPAQIDISKWKNIQGWLARIESRPSWAATAPQM